MFIFELNRRKITGKSTAAGSAKLMRETKIYKNAEEKTSSTANKKKDIYYYYYYSLFKPEECIFYLILLTWFAFRTDDRSRILLARMQRTQTLPRWQQILPHVLVC